MCIRDRNGGYMMELKKGIKYQVIKATKFKDIGISIRFLSPLSREKATAKSVLAMLFCDYCEKYPSKQQMANHLDELYGMTLNATTYGYGKGQVLELRSKVIDPKYINDEIDLLKEQFAFLHEVCLLYTSLWEISCNQKSECDELVFIKYLARREALLDSED